MAGTGIGLDVGQRNAKAAFGRDKGGQFQLLALAVHERPIGKDGAARDSVEDAVGEVLAAMPKKAPVVLGLTGRDLMLRYSQVPPLPVHRLKVLMDFEVDEIADKIDGDVSADYNILPGEVGDGSEQMAIIAMAKESSLAPSIDAALAYGPVRYATPNMLAATNAFLRFGSFQSGETTLHLDIGEENADLAIQVDGDIQFARNLNFGGRTFTDALASQFGLDVPKAEELKRAKGMVPTRGETKFADGLTEKTARVLQGVVGQLVGLVQSSISFCKVQWKRQDLKVDRVILSGGGSMLPGLPKALSEGLSIAVELFDPMDRLDTSQLDPDDEAELRKRPQMFAVPLGLALMAADDRFFSVQVLPARLRKQKVLKERTAFLVGAGVLAVGYLVVSAMLGMKSLSAAEARHEDLSRQEASRRRDESRYESIVAENEEKLARLALLQQQVRPGFALAKTVEAVQRQLDDDTDGSQGFDGLWIRTIELRDQNKRRSDSLPPVVVVEGAGIETDEDVSRVANRFAAALKKDVEEQYGARATSSFNRRESSFEIVIDFYAEPADDESSEGDDE